MSMDKITITDAAKWAANYTGRNITTSNISYLVNYGKIEKHVNNNNKTTISKIELKKYYDSHKESRIQAFKNNNEKT